MPHRRITGARVGLLAASGLASLCLVVLHVGLAADRAYGQTILRSADGRVLPDLFRGGYAGEGARFLAPPQKRQPIFGKSLPAWVKAAYDQPAQGSGPVPDKQLTPTAQSSKEFDAATPRLEKTARVVFVSDGVDEWVNEFEPVPGGPPPAPDDPNNRPDGQIDRWGVSPNGFNIWIMRHDGSQQLQLTNMAGDEREPAYDPGSTVLAFVNDRTGKFQIYTVDILTKTVRQISTDPGNKHNPTWSADGTEIAYATDLAGPSNRDIYKMKSRGTGAPVPLAASPLDESQPRFSPRGNWILYTRQDGASKHIWRMDASGGNQEQMTNGGGDPGANDRDPAWRQDGVGSTFAFASDRLSDITDTTRDFNIWSLAASGEVGGGGTALVISNTDPKDTRDDIMPVYSPVLVPVPPVGPDRAPTRVFFTSYRMDAVGAGLGTAEPDIWATILTDDRPPVLLELPQVSNRNPAPGSDIIVRCRPYDDETGISAVRAFFKDPDCAVDDAQGIDHKIYAVYLVNFEPNDFPGEYWMELDCDRIGSTQLFDDGDMANNGDAVAGDGIFSGIWTTPAVPSDFIIDIELLDNSGNAVNFDDVYGLSTVTFAPKTDVLLVDDYCEGQEFLGLAGFNNDWSFQFPCESYLTTNPSGSYDASNIAYNTFRDGIDGFGTDGEPYDLWRVICRGAPDLQTLTYYGPTAETQLTVDLTDIREIPVANRAVFWASAKSGDLWAADGTITDAATQALLTQFVQRGGRLVVAGMDIAWALTLDGRVSNPFLSNVLGAQFVRDDNSGRDIVGGLVPWFAVEGPVGDLLADDPWYSRTHYGDGLTNESDGGPDADDDTTVLMDNQPPNPDDEPDAFWWAGYPDVIQPSGSQQIYGYGGATAADGGAVKRLDTATGARVVYFAFPFEAIDRHYHSVNSVDHCRNKRSKLAHVTLCWLRTGGVQGHVLNQAGLVPITDPEPIVTIHALNQPQTILYAQRCLKDGTFVINGLPPAIYELQATRPGYKMDHTNENYQWVHGGLRVRVRDFVISEAKPGAIQGTVTSLATGDPIANVTVTAVSATDPLGATPIPSVLTGADGTYIIPTVPIGDYDVTADGSTATPPYGSDTALVTVIPGGSITQDFQLPAAPGTLLVTATDSQTNALLADVTVEALLNSVVVGSGLTDTAGEASLDLPPGTYNVLADKAGYSRATADATVLSVQTTPLAMKLDPLPPGSIAGQIYRASTPDEALGGVRVRAIVGTSIVAEVTSSTDWTYPGGGNPRYNYFIPSVPAGGRIEVQATKTGFTVTPDSRIVQVASGTVAYNVNFSVSALHSFPAGLQFMSVPFDYSTQPPPIVLGTPSGQSLKMAAWDVALGRYATYPTAPADRLRLGMAYWLNLPQAQDLVSEGKRATSPYLIPVGMGWNGIGNPFTKAIDFYALKVRDSRGVVRPIQEAFAAGQVRNGLFAYGLGGYRLSTSLAPYSGYWVYVSETVTLIVEDPDTRLTATGAEQEDRPALAKPDDGWLMPIEVSSGRMTDASMALGIAANGAVASVPKPPPPAGKQFVYATFDAGDKAPRAIDVRETGNQTWTLTVQTTNVGAPVTVTWPDLSQLPTTARPILRDPATGKTVYMRTQRGYSYRPGGEPSRALEIEVSDAPQGLLTVTAAAAPAGAKGVAVTYSLSRDARVTTQILNVAGRPIAQPVTDQPMPAGTHTSLWDGRNDGGAVVPSGRYFVRVTARSDDGQETTALASASVRR